VHSKACRAPRIESFLKNRRVVRDVLNCRELPFLKLKMWRCPQSGSRGQGSNMMGISRAPSSAAGIPGNALSRARRTDRESPAVLSHPRSSRTRRAHTRLTWTFYTSFVFLPAEGSIVFLSLPPCGESCVARFTRFVPFAARSAALNSSRSDEWLCQCTRTLRCPRSQAQPS
jgi:hypothetical protein